MTAAIASGSPVRIAPGVKFAYDGEYWTVIGLDGVTLRARGSRGLTAFLISEIAVYGEFHDHEAPESVEGADGVVAVDQDLCGLFDAISSPEQRAQALERVRLVHLLLTGFPDGIGGRGQEPSEFGPQSAMPLKDRAKALATAEGIGVRTLERWCADYRQHGPEGLIDKRSVAINDPLGDCPEEVRSALHRVMSVQPNRSKVTGEEFARQVRNIVLAEHGPEYRMPAERTLRRYISELSKHYGLHLAKKTQQGNQLRPKKMSHPLVPTRPFEIVEIDSTRLDVFAISPVDGRATSVTLTVALDVYSRAPVAWQFSAGEAKSVDATMLIHDMLSPKTMHPDWDARAGWRFGIPETLVLRCSGADGPLAGVPFGVPTTLSLDNGGIYISDAARGACARLGISLQYARPARPTDKPHIERFFGTVRTGFSEKLPGYKGWSVEARGTTKEVEDKACLFVWELEDLFAEWVASEYMNTPHSGLQEPRTGMKLTPAEAYNRGITVAGFMVTPVSPQLAISLLPAISRVVTRQGIEVDGLYYNSDDLDLYRGTKSPFGQLNGKWPIRVDGRDKSNVWFWAGDLIEPSMGRWVQIPSTVAMGQQPFSDVELEYVKSLLTQGDRSVGRDKRSDVLARAVERYLERVHSEGPANAREARVAGLGRGQVAQAERDFPRPNLSDDGEALTDLGHDSRTEIEPHVNAPDESRLHSVANVQELSEEDFFTDEEAS